jgi:ubiquinone biosynthesis protein
MSVTEQSMLNPALIEAYLRQLSPEQLRDALAGFLPGDATPAERIATIEAALLSPTGELLRAEMGRWIVHQIVPVEKLVPEAYLQWRAPVRDCMLFVISRLSAARLAPKILEQIELPPDTPPEARLLRLIAKVPGLQKLGQVIARNRHLSRALRNALTELENGIRDVTVEDVCAIVQEELAPRLEAFDVHIEPAMLSEASVSAVVRFTWKDPESGMRERGVFKVLKPYIPACFAEDMDTLQQLADFFGTREGEYGPVAHVIPDTFTKVRRLLQHEVDFPREQETLVEAEQLYRSMPGVRVPRVIHALCTPTITAITEEHGAKVTTAATGLSGWRRGRMAEQMIEALVAVPLLSAESDAIFHADPHAGNLLYNNRTGELVVLDWALTERLSREQRRRLALLVAMVALRDPVGASIQIKALSQRGARGRNARQSRVIRNCATSFLDELPVAHLPGAVDAMRLLERVALRGVRFPAPLIMFSKVLFTLDGILHDIGGSGASMLSTMTQHLVKQFVANRAAFASPLRHRDWLAVACSAALYTSRLVVRWEWAALNWLLPRPAPAPATSN